MKSKLCAREVSCVPKERVVCPKNELCAREVSCVPKERAVRLKMSCVPEKELSANEMCELCVQTEKSRVPENALCA